MPRRATSTAFLITLLAALLAGCDPAPTQHHVAVASTGADVTIRFTSCTNEQVAHVRLLKSSDPVVYNVESDPTVWQLDLRPSSHANQFTVGTAPADSTEAVSVKLPLQEDALYVAVIETTAGATYDQPFKLTDMPGGLVAFDYRYLSPNEYEHLAACPSPR